MDFLYNDQGFLLYKWLTTRGTLELVQSQSQSGARASLELELARGTLAFWLTRGTLIGERFSLLFFLFYVFLIALGPALLQYGLQDFFGFFFLRFVFLDFALFFIFNISLFGFCSALHRSGLQLDLIMYNHCKVSRLISRQHFLLLSFLAFLSHVPLVQRMESSRNVLLRL